MQNLYYNNVQEEGVKKEQKSWVFTKAGDLSYNAIMKVPEDPIENILELTAGTY